MASSRSLLLASSSPWASLPPKPGVYIFKNTQGEILYVGKAKSLRVRVRSYFQPPSQLGYKTAKLVSQISSLEHIEVGSEIESLLLESRLIRRFQPPYNLISKDDKSPYFIHLTTEAFPKPIINHEPAKPIAGPFLNAQIPRRLLRHFRKIAPFCTAARNVKRPCIYAHLGLCSPCPGDPATTVAAYKPNISRLKRLLHGQFKQVSADLTGRMKSASKAHDFESAAKLRDQLHALDFLLQSPIMPEEYIQNPNLTQDRRQESLDSLIGNLPLAISNLHRIELYDIANLSGTSATGAMVVAIDGELSTKDYRHFTIHTKDTPDDVGMLKEMLSRRLKHTDWSQPDLIVLDGGRSQLSIVNWPIPTIGLAKKEELLVVPTTSGYTEIKLPKTHPGLHLLMRLRDEAHRFSRRLHHKHRAKLVTG